MVLWATQPPLNDNLNLPNGGEAQQLIPGPHPKGGDSGGTNGLSKSRR